MPKLAEEVFNLNEALNLEKERVEELSAQLEDPEKHPHKIDLDGEDPDTEALNAKI